MLCKAAATLSDNALESIASLVLPASMPAGCTRGALLWPSFDYFAA
jgi:hypothetical protein